MENQNKHAFINLNFNLKNEIFAFVYHPKDIINLLFPICKSFSEAVKNKRWYKYIKQEFNELLSKTHFEYTKMQDIMNLFKDKFDSETLAYQLCIYFSLRKLRDKVDANFFIIEKNDLEDERNIEYYSHIISSSNRIELLDLSYINFGKNEKNMFNLRMH